MFNIKLMLMEFMFVLLINLCCYASFDDSWFDSDSSSWPCEYRVYRPDIYHRARYTTRDDVFLGRGNLPLCAHRATHCLSS
jgi:hypothetical protein